MTPKAAATTVTQQHGISVASSVLRAGTGDRATHGAGAFGAAQELPWIVERCERLSAMSNERDTNPRIYLNHAGTSFPKPAAVHAALAEVLASDPSEQSERYERDLNLVAAALGAAPERIRLTGSCTHALDVVISDLDWEHGDEIVTSQLEHHAMIRPIQNLARLRGVRHVRAPYRPGEPIDLDFVRSRLQRGRVKLVAVCTASNVTGEVLPVRALAELAHEHGAWCLADAAQTFGSCEHTVSSLGCDLLTFAGHKNPLGPRGIGGFWVAPEVAFQGGAASCEVRQEGAPSCEAPMPGFCDVGSVAMEALAGLAAGLTAFGVQRAARMDAARRMAADLANRARELPGVTVFGHQGAPQTAAVSLLAERLSLYTAQAAFAEHGITVRSGQHCAPQALEAIGAPRGTIRVSFGATNRAEDVEAVLAVLQGHC